MIFYAVMDPDPESVETLAPKLMSYGAGLIPLAAFVGLALILHSGCKPPKPPPPRPTESETMENLKTLRTALNYYYAEHDLRYPETVAEVLEDARYFDEIPYLAPGEHRTTNKVTNYPSRSAQDTGTWGYVDNPSDHRVFGTVFIDCTHTDSNSSLWAAY